MNLRKSIYKLLNIGIIKRFPRHSVRYAKQKFNDKSIVVIEIGTFYGYNAESILKELNVEKVYLVDPYEEYIEYDKKEDGKSQQTLSNAESLAKKRLKRFDDKIIWVKKYSDDAVNSLPKADFIYIDGNHSKTFVKKDMINYFKLLKEGGIMGGHDITSEFGVQEAFVEFCYENKLRPHISRTDWWVEK